MRCVSGLKVHWSSTGVKAAGRTWSPSCGKAAILGKKPRLKLLSEPEVPLGAQPRPALACEMGLHAGHSAVSAWETPTQLLLTRWSVL